MGEVCLPMAYRYVKCLVNNGDVNCHTLQSIETAIRRLNDIGVFTVFVILDSLLKVGCVVYLC